MQNITIKDAKQPTYQLGSAWVKIHQIFVIFETIYQFFFKFCIKSLTTNKHIFLESHSLI